MKRDSPNKLDSRSLAKPLDLRSVQPGIPEIAGLVLERELHHAFCADIGKWIDQYRIHNAENRAGSADTERKRKEFSRES